MMIKVYTNKACPNCEALKKKLILLHIIFHEINVAEDDDAMTELVMHNITSTPVIEVEGMFFEFRDKHETETRTS